MSRIEGAVEFTVPLEELVLRLGHLGSHPQIKLADLVIRHEFFGRAFASKSAALHYIDPIGNSERPRVYSVSRKSVGPCLIGSVLSFAIAVSTFLLLNQDALKACARRYDEPCGRGGIRTY